MTIKLTQEYIQSLFNYGDGFLYWKINKSQRIHIDDKAGTLNNTGYYSIGINGKIYRNHRLIFLYHYGYLPKQLDHIDRNKLNNKIENLREATQSQNMMNRKSFKNTSSQYKGVTWDRKNQKWLSQIKINKKLIHLGRFKFETDAAKAYNIKSIELFGEYAKLNEVDN